MDVGLTSAAEIFGESGVEIAPGAPTNSTFVTIEADDGVESSGIKEIRLRQLASGNGSPFGFDGTAGKGLRNFETPLRVQTVRFPDPAKGEAQSFVDGDRYEANIKDFVGNETSVNIIRKRPSSLDEPA